MKNIETTGRYILLALGATFCLLLVCWHALPPLAWAIGALLPVMACGAGVYAAVRDLSDGFCEDRNSGFWTYLALLGYLPIVIGLMLFTMALSNDEQALLWPIIRFLLLASACNLLFLIAKQRAEKEILEHFTIEQLATLRAERIVDQYERYYVDNIRAAVPAELQAERRPVAVGTVKKALLSKSGSDVPDFDLLFPGATTGKCLTKLFEADFCFSGTVIPRTLKLHALILLCFSGQCSTEDDYLIQITGIDNGVRRGATYRIYRYFDFDQRHDPYYAAPVPVEGLWKKQPMLLMRPDEVIRVQSGSLHAWPEITHECLPSKN